MGDACECITDDVARFIERQNVFFVATAPLAAAGRVNLSPKGLDSLRVLDELTVAYLDLNGSGAETIAHLRENGRITLMFCAFEGPPNILRMQGTGEAIFPGSTEYAALAERLPALPGIRAIIRVHCQRISFSCGFGVPRYEYVENRRQLTAWAEQKGPAGLAEYQRKNNRVSIDGLPALDV
ncbi:MAG: pyridoxamine 5'-phosphate oxidase family protein [Pirellulales bacterium]|nr:pyridoxamine 5'-phosphate oxidase family protein [Pirellulales bacterium]